MKTISKLIALTSVLPLLCQCNPTPQEDDTPKTTTITASLADMKVSMTAGGESSLALAWQDGDELLVAGGTEEIFTLTEIDAADAHKATFEGNEVEGTTFDVYYPADYSALSHDYTNQVQDGNASTAHLVFNAVAQGLTDYHEISFTKVNGAVRLDVVLPEDVTAVEGVAITAKNSSDEPLEVFYKTNDTEGEKASMLYLGFDDAAVPDGNHVVTAYMMVSWNPVELAEGTVLEVQAIVPGKGCRYVKNITLAENATISGGQVYKLDLSAEAPLAHTLSGNGTEDDPYILWDCEDLLCIRPIIEANPNVYQYFRLACDIDMTGIENWKPINDGNVKDASGTQFAGRIHFDGNNKTLSNLKSTNNAYTSFFGVLIGSVKDLKFVNPVISATSSSCAVIGGYIGQSNNPGKIENVTITGANVSYTNGSAVAAIAGAVIATAEISGVTVSNSTFTYNAKDSNNAVGILFGNQNNKNYTISITGCHSLNNTATLTSAPKYLGGVIGYLCAGTISQCSVTGDLSATCNNIGGIVGNMEAGKISECRYSGNMTVKDNSGGIAGAQSTTGATSDVIIENCYTTGTITNSGSQKCGGIAGECCKNAKIRNCYSTMSISGGGRVFGNIAGRFNNNQWNGNSDTDLNMEVTNCIAAGSINSTDTNTTHGSSGALLGVAPCKVAHYTNCWRTYGYSFKCAYAAGATLVDQGYTVTSYTVGTYAGSANSNSNWWPYHGSEATASALASAYNGWTTAKTDEQITVSDIASAVNYSDSNAWKSDIWDLSGDYPTLKNNPEPAE